MVERGVQSIFYIFILVLSFLWAEHSFGQATKDSVSTRSSALNFSELFETYDGRLGLSMFGATLVEGQDEAHVIRLQFQPSFYTAFNSWFDMTSMVTVKLNSSRVQSRFNNIARNGIYVDNLGPRFHWKEYLSLEAGTISQDHIHNNLLVDFRQSFPGALLLGGIDEKKYKIYGKYQYAIPQSYSLDADRTDSEPVPLFHLLGIQAEYKDFYGFNFQADVHQFSFEKLPSIVAFESGRTGNTVLGEQSADSRFKYQFRGWAQNYKLSWDYTSRLGQFAQLESVDNLGAPQGKNRAQRITIGANIRTESVDISPWLGPFYNETDATPSFYIMPEWGRANRKGWTYGLDMAFKKLGFTFGAFYVEAPLLGPSGLQNDHKFLQLVFEVQNVKL